MDHGELTEDLLLGGRLRVRQPAQGYRVNADTILLAAAAAPGARLMEAGCGVGAGLLAVAQRIAGASLLGVERDQNIAAIARENVALNAMSARAEIVTGDVLARDPPWGVFDGVFFNPPYDDGRLGRAPSEARRHAHIADAPITAWIAALADRLKGGGVMTLIHRAEMLGEILGALDGRLGGPEVLPVAPYRDASAKRILVRARKGSRAPLRLWPPLVLHERGGAKYTPETEAIMQGAALSWPG